MCGAAAFAAALDTAALPTGLLVASPILLLTLLKRGHTGVVLEDRTSALSAYFDAQDDIVLAVLFGSFGTAAERPDSDVDVAVLWQPPGGRAQALSVERRLTIVTELAQRTGRAIDLVDMASAGVPILGAALTTGRTLVARDPDVRSTLLVRYLIDAADFMPYYERILSERRAAWIAS